MRNRSQAQAYAFVFPLVLLEGMFVLVPLAIGIYYSLHRADFFRVTAFRGLQNYWQVIQSPAVVESLAVTAIFSLSSLFLTFVVGFSLALFLERDSRVHVFVRTVILLPYIISMLVGSMLLKWLFSQDGGLLQLVLGPLGLGQVPILGDPNGAMAALVFNAVWHDSAFAMILLMAGLKGIPAQLYAAARVDGANAFLRFRRITLPLMQVPIVITLIRLLIHFVNVLTFPLILTGGGPDNATQTMGLTLYRMGFVDYRIGQANALAMLVFIFNVTLILLLAGMFRGRLTTR